MCAVLESHPKRTVAVVSLLYSDEYTERDFARRLADKLGWKLLDGSSLICVNSRGEILEKSYENISETLDAEKSYVVTGSFASDRYGRVQRLEIDGPGVSAAAIAVGLSAGLLEYWGQDTRARMADPLLVQNPAFVKQLTYQEMRELSSIGADVPSEQIVIPLQSAGIPLSLLDLNHPGKDGTLISADRDDSDEPVIGVYGRTGYCRVHVRKVMVNRDPDFKLKIRTLLKIHGVDPEFSSIGFDSLSFYFRQELLSLHSEIPERIKAELFPDEISTEERLAMIGIVGKGLYDRKGVLADISRALADGGISIRFLNYGGSVITCILGVDETDYHNSVRIIYETLCRKQA
jgi:aspartate kinase